MPVLCLLVFFGLLSVGGGQGEVFRISRVVAVAGEGVERHSLIVDEREEVLLVAAEAIVTEKDVRQVTPDYARPGVLMFDLYEEGGERLRKATAALEPGRERLAYFYQGRLLAAPWLQGKTGAQFMVTGLAEMTLSELMAMADTICQREVSSAAEGATDGPGVERPVDDDELRAGEEETRLEIIFPEGELAAFTTVEEVVAFFEAAKIVDSGQGLSPADLRLLTAMALNLANLAEGKGRGEIRIDCDLLRCLAHQLPDMGLLCRKAMGERVSLLQVRTVLWPYGFEGKALPAPSETLFPRLGPGAGEQ
ncbi:hypothetical protein [Roseibacillus ishigakijimensis]|uniref:Uncharacterized protein n=1 Tax=Roseibacillus ishigakijimensis TaxID=454146 RepID=A0A934RND1_9BACT|nr:hypothetical protein [Roseibacillus ishigakijimensis]MBK1833993.1 hypothetical protein [Roseibacillus ishigakijimensis]